MYAIFLLKFKEVMGRMVGVVPISSLLHVKYMYVQHAYSLATYSEQGMSGKQQHDNNRPSKLFI